MSWQDCQDDYPDDYEDYDPCERCCLVGIVCDKFRIDVCPLDVWDSPCQGEYP